MFILPFYVVFRWALQIDTNRFGSIDSFPVGRFKAIQSDLGWIFNTRAFPVNDCFRHESIRIRSKAKLRIAWCKLVSNFDVKAEQTTITTTTRDRRLKMNKIEVLSFMKDDDQQLKLDKNGNIGCIIRYNGNSYYWFIHLVCLLGWASVGESKT